MSKAGYRDSLQLMRGSSVTGVRYRDKRPFDQGRRSDLDVALVSPTLFRRARDAGAQVIGAKHDRTQPLRWETMERLGLLNSQSELQSYTGRKVTYVIYRNLKAVKDRSQPFRRIPYK